MVVAIVKATDLVLPPVVFRLGIENYQIVGDGPLVEPRVFDKGLLDELVVLTTAVKDNMDLTLLLKANVRGIIVSKFIKPYKIEHSFLFSEELCLIKLF